MTDHLYSRLVRLNWANPPRFERSRDAMAEMISEPEGAFRGDVSEHLRARGYLVSDPTISPKQELLTLLRIAVEVEHALLVQYLYAAASVASGPVGDVIRDVAIQEMGHFITVENLLVAVGGPATLHIGRDVARNQSEFNPIPFDLEPVSKVSLAEFVLAERPEHIPQEHQAKVLELEQLVSGKIGYEPVRVGALYAKIYWLLQPSDEPFGPLTLTPDTSIGFDPGRHIRPEDYAPAAVVADHIADPEEWHSSSGPDMRIHPVTDSRTAVEAVYSLMAQGEGPASARDSHFDLFLAALGSFELGTGSVLPLPTNPYVGRLPFGVTVGVQIQHEYVRLWANLLNARYTGLLLAIGHAMLTPRSNPDRAILIGLIFGVLMGRHLGGLIGIMTMPMMSSFDRNSAPTFELLREDMPLTLRECWIRQSELLDLEIRIHEELRLRSELVGDVDGTILLGNLERGWREVRELVDLRLAVSQ
jgi:hypothetical protein